MPNTAGQHLLHVEQARAAGHVPTGKTELGYTRQICRECESDWPCPEFAQAAHRDADPEDCTASDAKPTVTRYADTTEIAKVLRGVLKAEFPGVKFSVRSDRYSMGSSIRVAYDAELYSGDVDAIVRPYRGADFDGMTDSTSHRTITLPTGERVNGGGDYIFTDNANRAWDQAERNRRLGRD